MSSDSTRALESVLIRLSSIILVIWPLEPRLFPQARPQYSTQPTENASLCSTHTAGGDISRPISILSAFSAPCLILIFRSTANSPKKRDASTAAPLARSSCTSLIPRGAAGFRSAWKAHNLPWTSARVLDLLIRAELFEQVLQHRYLGNKRFSLEGVTALIPLMDEILEAAGQNKARGSW